jgi:4-amino-4-deoxy-L-arabinose transferase-like glycosyltransferase
MAARARLVAVLLVTALAALTRWVAVRDLPPDYDELVYLPVGFHYAERMTAGRWWEISGFTENPEHPPLGKIAFGAALRASGAAEPAWDQLQVGQPLPPEAVPAFRAPRQVSAAAGVLQVALAALAAPAGGAWLALDTYHVKYSAEAMLEGLAGLFALLAVLSFERAIRRRAPVGLLAESAEAGPGWLLAAGLALGLATSTKYAYGLVAGLAMLPFLLRHTRGRLALRLGFAVAVLTALVATDPALWHDPFGRLWRSVGFHFDYAVGEHVKEVGYPWWQPLTWLTVPYPDRWHPGVFKVAFLDWLLLPAALLSMPAAWRRRPVFVAWAASGLLFVLVWPTRWPQYTMMFRPALAVCIGLGLSAIWERVTHGRRVDDGLSLR